jgi:hypothetical protein
MCNRDVSDNNAMNRQRLKPWLEGQINNGRIPGLLWLDEGKTKFKVPWKHNSRGDWTPEHALIFQEWAKQTGKFREGVDKPEYVKWKTRLRCALHKSQDFEYVEEESDEKEDCPEPFRVYRVLQRTGNKRIQNGRLQAQQLAGETQQQATVNPAGVPLPAVLDNIQIESTENMPSDLRDIPSDEISHLADAGTEAMSFSINDSFSEFDVNPAAVNRQPNVQSVLSREQQLMMEHLFPQAGYDIELLTESMSSLTFDKEVTCGTVPFTAAEAAVPVCHDNAAAVSFVQSQDTTAEYVTQHLSPGSAAAELSQWPPQLTPNILNELYLATSSGIDPNGGGLHFDTRLHFVEANNDENLQWIEMALNSSNIATANAAAGGMASVFPAGAMNNVLAEVVPSSERHDLDVVNLGYGTTAEEVVGENPQFQPVYLEDGGMASMLSAGTMNNVHAGVVPSSGCYGLDYGPNAEEVIDENSQFCPVYLQDLVQLDSTSELNL